MGGAPDLEEAARDADEWGLSDMAAELAAEEPEDFGIWPENMGVADAWLVVCTQWNTTALPTGQVLYHGLRYTDVQAGLGGAAIDLSPEDWSKLRLMERVAAAIQNGRRG